MGKYIVSYEREDIVDVEDGEATEEQIQEALVQEMFRLVRDDPHEGTVYVNVVTDNYGADYKVRVVVKPPAYPTGLPILEVEAI